MRSGVAKVWFFVAVALVGLLNLGLAAASKVQLEVWLTLGTPEMQRIKEMLPDFNSAHPDIVVNLAQISWTGYNEKVLTAFASGTAPDILMAGASGVWQVVHENLGIPLDARARLWNELGDFAPGALAGTSYAGRLYGIPLMAPSRAVWYRRDLFAESGLNPEEPPVTWSEIRDAARRLARRQGDRVTRIGFSVPSDIYRHAFLTNGVRWLSDDVRRITFNTPEALEALAFWSELALEMRYDGSTLSIKPFEQGGIGMILGYPPPYLRIAAIDPALVEQMGGPVVMKNRAQAAFTYPDWVYITTQSKHPNEAWTFITWLNSPRVQPEFMKLTPHPPSRKASFQHEHYRSKAGKLAVRMFAEATLPYGTKFEPMPGFLQWSQITDEVWGKILNRELSPRAGLDEMERRLSAFLAETWKQQESRR